MQISFRSGIFVAQSTFEEVSLLSGKRGGAGWRFHGRDCRAAECRTLPANTWWTPDVEKALPLARFFDDSAKTATREVAEAVELSAAPSADIEIPAPEGLEYLPYQRAGIAYATQKPRVMIADEMGLGKTIQAIGTINALERDGQIKRRVLILCPASLRINWRRECEKWLVHPREAQIVGKGKDVIDPGCGLTIVNYDLIINAKILEQVRAVNWWMIVCDEAHVLKNTRGAARAQIVLGYYQKADKEGDRGQNVPGLIQRCERAILLTGTPLPNGRPMEAFPALSTLAPEAFGNWFQFATRYGGGQKEWNKWAGKEIWTFDPERTKANLPELQRKMRAHCMVRRSKAQVLTDLPPKRHQLIPLAADGISRLLSREAKVIGNYGEAVSTLMRGDSLGFEELAAVRAELAEAKIPHVVEHLKDALDEQNDDGTNANQKVIVFAHHHKVIDAIAAAFPGMCAIVDGRTAMVDRQDAVDKFQDPKSRARIFLGQIQAAGVGLTLTASSLVVFAELSWVPGDNQQAEDRAHRIGQTNTVLVQHLVFDGSLDAHIAAELVSKAKRSSIALDEADPFQARIDELLPEIIKNEGRRARAKELIEVIPQTRARAHRGRGVVFGGAMRRSQL